VEPEREAKAAASLLTCLVACSKQSQTIHEILGKVIGIIFGRLGSCRTTTLRVKVGLNIQ
jgi:hypothetical protein